MIDKHWWDLEFDNPGKKFIKKNNITNLCCSIVLKEFNIKHKRLMSFKINSDFIFIKYRKHLLNDERVTKIHQDYFMKKLNKRNLLLEKI